jgi:tetratricopeptide (TPR) repeat protein
MAGHLEDAYQFFRSQLAESLSSQPGNQEREAKHLRMFLNRDDKKSVLLANPRDRAWVLNRLAACSLQAARPSRGLELYEQGNPLYEQAGEMDSLAAGLIGMARCQMLLGQLQAADASLRRSLDISFQFGLQEQVALSHLWLGLLQALIGEWNQSATSLDDALMTARRLQDYMLEGEAWLKSSRSLLIRGWHVTALNGLEEVQRCLLMVPPEGVGVAHLWTEYHWLAGWANLDAGKLEQGQAHLEEASMRAVRFQNRLIMPSISFARARLSMTLSMRMELEPLVSAVETLRQDAWAQLSEAQTQAIEQETPLMRADIHCFLGMLAKDAGQEKMARQHAKRAYDYAQGGIPRYAYFRAVRCAEHIDPSLTAATVTERERALGANETSEMALLAA